jgi:hypothetical protein
VNVLRITVAAAALAMAPAMAIAQEQVPAQQPPAEVQQKVVEMQQLEQQLAPVQAEALQDPTIQQAQAELNQAVIAAMMEGGAEVQADLQRVESIQPELAAAQESGDQEQLGRLVHEAQALQDRLGQAQMLALQEPALAAQAEQSRRSCVRGWRRSSRSPRAMLERLATLQAEVLQAMQGPPGR